VDAVTDILETTPVGRKTLVERDGVTLIVFPVGNTWWDHPFLLFLGSSFAWGTVENGGWRTGRATGDFFVLKARGLQGVLHNLGHFDDPLLQAIRVALLTGSIPNERRLSLTVRNVLRLRSLDLSVRDLFKSGLGFLRCCGNLLFRGTLHCPVRVREVFAVHERNEVFEL
jgi:hypothetical protein